MRGLSMSDGYPAGTLNLGHSTRYLANVHIHGRHGSPLRIRVGIAQTRLQHKTPPELASNIIITITGRKWGSRWGVHQTRGVLPQVHIPHLTRLTARDRSFLF
jgi:hypothetical protein